MSMRKVCAACLTALFAAGTATALQAADAAKTAPSTFKPGTYTATVNGHNAPVTVKVTVSKNRIEKIDTSKNLETIGVGRVALKLMTDKILKYQSLGVDAITGASISSLALLSGVDTPPARMPASTKQPLSSASGRSVEVRMQTAGNGCPTLVKKLDSSGRVPESLTTANAFICRWL